MTLCRGRPTPHPCLASFAWNDVDVTLAAPDGRLADRWRYVCGRRLEGMQDSESDVPIGTLFLLSRPGASHTTLRPATRRRALTVVLEETTVTGASALSGIKMLERRLSNRSVFECEIGESDIDGAIMRMVEAQRQCANPR